MGLVYKCSVGQDLTLTCEKQTAFPTTSDIGQEIIGDHGQVIQVVGDKFCSSPCGPTKPTVSLLVTRELQIQMQTDGATDAGYQQLYEPCKETSYLTIHMKNL